MHRLILVLLGSSNLTFCLGAGWSKMMICHSWSWQTRRKEWEEDHSGSTDSSGRRVIFCPGARWSKMIICLYILIICQHSWSLCIDWFRWAGRSRINMLSRCAVIKCYLLSRLLNILLTFLWENYKNVKMTTLSGLDHRDNLSLFLNTVHRLILVGGGC